MAISPNLTRVFTFSELRLPETHSRSIFYRKPQLSVRCAADESSAASSTVDSQFDAKRFHHNLTRSDNCNRKGFGRKAETLQLMNREYTSYVLFIVLLVYFYFVEFYCEFYWLLFFRLMLLKICDAKLVVNSVVLSSRQVKLVCELQFIIDLILKWTSFISFTHTILQIDALLQNFSACSFFLEIMLISFFNHQLAGTIRLKFGLMYSWCLDMNWTYLCHSFATILK